MAMTKVTLYVKNYILIREHGCYYKLINLEVKEMKIVFLTPHKTKHSILDMAVIQISIMNKEKSHHHCHDVVSSNYGVPFPPSIFLITLIF